MHPRQRNRKHRSPEAGGSRASKGNWKKARWPVLWQSGMNYCHMDGAISVLELVYTSKCELIPHISSQLHIQWRKVCSLKLAIVGVSTHKNCQLFFAPGELGYQQITGLNYVELCPDSESSHSRWFLIWELKQPRDMSWERERDCDFQWLSRLMQQEQTNWYKECPLAFWL